ncbi:MBOAT family O-acyltransferase [Haloferula sargassicola]|uniref:Peptidoglycan O-acetyltransferase n=1 Tax=Haloferula sargassicola TaxID=490096 RepID=A0ABP9UKG2_9BACT
MLFNSYIYLLIFLPLTYAGFLLFRRTGLRAAMGWLVLASLIYYGWWNPNPAEPWNPAFLGLIVGSCLANFFFGRYLAQHHGPRGKRMLALGVTANLGLLGYFKYAGLFTKTIVALTGAGLTIPDVLLPLGISFFTFQQIAYLVDAYRGETKEYRITDYFLFVTFFPQLIAGPIVHHKEVMPQLERTRSSGRRSIDLSVGLTILAIGLFKKVVLADNFAPIATRLFEQASLGERHLTMGEAWAATIAYALQIYFDFSGYSDMAIGSARLFGIRLPVNFHSPYKATSLIEFWRRWHITLSRFLRDYLYIPLGGNRLGVSRRYFNLFLTMLLGGLWHGAGWTYVLWGALHGFYLCVNHGWVALRKSRGWPKMPAVLGGALTFLAVLVAWVPFRAGSFELGPHGSTTAALDAIRSVLESMFGFHGISAWPDRSSYVVKASHAYRAIACVLLVWLLPNTQQWMRRYQPALGLRSFSKRPILGSRITWRPTPKWSIFVLLLLLGVIYQFDKLSEFIYFQF